MRLPQPLQTAPAGAPLCARAARNCQSLVPKYEYGRVGREPEGEGGADVAVSFCLLCKDIEECPGPFSAG